MRIAPQHAWKDKDYSPACAWAEDTYVQWGGNGVVLGKNCYRTAFFEAFPADKEHVGGFIRGEGETIEEAERSAFAKYERQSVCSHHWGREHYLNGGQLCRHCRAFRCGFLQPVVVLGSWRRPVDRWEDTHIKIDDGMQVEEPDHEPSKWIRKLRLRKSVFGIRSHEQ